MAEEIQIETISKEVTTPKLAKAAIGFMDSSFGITSLGFNSSTGPDKLFVPDKWVDIVKMVRFYYEREPIASQVVDKSVDIGINAIENIQGDATEEVLKVYDYILDEVLSFTKEMSREYNLSGLVIPEVNMGPKTVTIDGEEKVYTLPTNLWLRDPATIVVKKTPIPNRINYYVEVDSETIDFIMNNGAYSDGTKDVETYKLLVAKYPEFVRLVKSGETLIPLTNLFMVIRRSAITGKSYPKPYLFSVLESLTYKRRLKQMDYSIASRVISAIQLVKLGSDLFPILQEDQDQIEDLKKQIRHEGRENNIERVFQLFGNHTLQIEWVFPDVKAMLDKTKYDVVNSDIMFGLGFPRILLSGETEKSATSSPEFAMFSPSETLKSMRSELLPFLKKLYKEIARLNGFDKYPTPRFADLNLYDVAKMTNVVTALLAQAGLSRTSALKTAGYDFMTEIENKVREREVMEENNIPEFNEQAFSPKPSIPGQTQQPKPKEEAKSNLFDKVFGGNN